MEEGKVFYRKLIRDKVPDKMTNLGVAFETRTLTEEEFKIELKKKVEEEASGVVAASSKEELIAELADVVDVIDEIMKVEGITEEELAAAKEKNMQKKGGFDDHIFLEWSQDNGYTSNEKKGS